MRDVAQWMAAQIRAWLGGDNLTVREIAALSEIVLMRTHGGPAAMLRGDVVLYDSTQSPATQERGIAREVARWWLRWTGEDDRDAMAEATADALLAGAPTITVRKSYVPEPYENLPRAKAAG